MKYTQWKDICIRTDSDGIHYLLQERRRLKDNKCQVKNILLDRPHHFSILHYVLFFGNQEIEKLIKRSPEKID